jgi:hypothetical protein
MLNTSRSDELKLAQQDFCLIQRMAVPLKLRDQVALPVEPPLRFAHMLLSPFKVSRSLVGIRVGARHVVKPLREAIVPGHSRDARPLRRITATSY